MITKDFFGKMPSGADVYQYTLENENGASVKILTLGGILRSINVPDKNGVLADVVCGYDDVNSYLTCGGYQGALIGRFGNRIKSSKFTLDGVEYKLYNNEKANHLHGGKEGFDKKIWDVKSYQVDDTMYLELSYFSPDMEEGYPGNLNVKVTYSFDNNCALGINYKATTDKKTVLNLTNHAYFNLNGLGGDVLSHEIEIFANAYTSVGKNLIPDGKTPHVTGTAMDFLTPHTIGERIGEVEGGYDHNYILSPKEHITLGNIKLGLAERVRGERLTMKVYTDRPGIQFYTGNFLGGAPDFKGSIKRIKHGAFCLETQIEPNGINKGIGFYDEGEVYSHNTLYCIERK